MTKIANTSQGSKYSDEDRLRAIVEFSVVGSLAMTSRNTGIPRTTLIEWKKQEWWDEHLAEVRLQNKELIESKVEQLTINGFQAMADRIENGDTYIAKDGSLQKKPVSLRDLSTATGISFDKLRLIRNEPTSIKAESTDKRLADLADKVRELQGGMVTIEGETVKDKE